MFLSYDQIDVSVSSEGGGFSRKEIEAIRAALGKIDEGEFTVDSGHTDPKQGYLVFLSEKGGTDKEDHEAYATELANAVRAANVRVRKVNISYIDAIVQTSREFD